MTKNATVTSTAPAPATATPAEPNVVSLFGYDIPIWDRIPAGEFEVFETLIREGQNTAGIRFALTYIAEAVNCRVRPARDITYDDLKRLPMDPDEVTSGLTLLMAPLRRKLDEQTEKKAGKKVLGEALTG